MLSRNLGIGCSVGIVLAAAAALVSSCASERAVDQQNPESVIYLSAMVPDTTAVLKYSIRLYTFDVGGGGPIDSISLDAYPWNIEVSADGDALYLLLVPIGTEQRPDSSVLRRVDISTATFTWERKVDYEWPGNIILMDGDRQLLLRDERFDAATGLPLPSSGDSLYYLDGIRSDVLAAAVHKDLYKTRSDTLVRVVNIETGELLQTFACRLGSGQPLFVSSCSLHPDGEHITVIGFGAQTGSWFIYGRVSDNRILIQRQLVYPYGELAYSGDGRFAAVTDPSPTFQIDTYQSVELFALDSGIHIGSVSQSDHSGFEAGQVSFFPGGECKLIVAPVSDGSRFGPTSIIDPYDLQNLKSICYPGCYTGTVFGAVAVGRVR